MPITLEDRRDYVEGMAPLYLHVAWRLLRDGMPWDDVFSYGVDLYRLTSLFDGKTIPYHKVPGWRDETWDGLMAQLRAIYDCCTGDADSAAFEHEGVTLFWPVLEPAIERGVAGWPKPEDRPYGFFACNLAELTDPDVHGVEIHLFNPFSPASPFADPQARMGELLRLIDDTQREHPEVTDIATGTWLNAFPPFLAFFPPEWAASATLVTVDFPGAGLWGQFFDRRGRFHRENGEYLRRTGEFRYRPMRCRCRIDTLRDHLLSAMK